MREARIKEILQGSYFFRDCGIDLTKISHEALDKGRMISDRQNGQNHVVLVVKGKIEVYSIALDGKEILLSLLKEGDCFGISNLFLSDTELPTVLMCAADSEVLLIPKHLLIEAMKANGELAIRYATIYNRKIQFLLQKIESLTMQSGKCKVAEYLLSHADDQDVVTLEHSKEHFASVLGISRASLFRELSYFQNEEIIAPVGNEIRIRRRKRLEEILYQSRR